MGLKLTRQELRDCWKVGSKSSSHYHGAIFHRGYPSLFLGLSSS